MIKTKNIFTFLLCAVLLVLTLLLPPSVPKLYADEQISNFDNTNIVDDLTTSIVNGEPFDIADYPFVNNAPMQLFNFVEYGYSYKPNLQNYYGLYLYIYNPSALDINTSSLSNKVQIALEYSLSGKPTDYGKLRLKFCSKITGGEYNNLFYKFRIVDPDNIILNRINETDPYKRRYDISGFELLNDGSMNANEYSVSFSYIFTGFAVGLGNNNSTSTLECFPTELETIELDVNYTNFRPNGWSELGQYHQNDLTSVYFSVPNKYIDDYGYIKRIKAEWYEYKTNPIIVTNNALAYSSLKNYVGYDVGSSGDDNIQYSLFKHNYLYSGGGDFYESNYKWSWNAFLGFKNNHGISSDNICTMFPFLFYSAESNIYDAFIPKENVKDYIYNYDESFYTGKLEIKSGDISADLFQGSVDDGRKKGYNEKIYDSDNKDDWFDLTSKDIRSGWDKFFGIGGKGDLSQYFKDIKPIEFIDEDYLQFNDKAFSETFFINETEVSDFKEYCKAEIENDNTVVLLRVANTDYYSFPLMVSKSRIPPINWQTTSNVIKDSAYYASETVFLDFDIIWLDFVKEGNNTIIPVVSSPIDVVSGITPPLISDNSCAGFTFDFPDWIWLVVAFIILVFILALLSALIKPIKIILCIIFLPFTIIYYLFKPKGGG